MSKIKKLLNEKKLYLCIIIALLFFGIFLKEDYALDTFCVLQHRSQQITESFSQGRFLKGIFYELIINRNISFRYKYFISYLIAIIALTISIYKLEKIISKDIKNEIFSLIISTLIIINPFSIELMMFYEKGIMFLGVLFSVYAVDFFIKNLEKNRFKDLVLSIVFMTLADFSYQGISAIYLALSAVYICKYSKNIKNFIVNNLKMALVYALPAILNVLIVRFIFINERVNGKIRIIESIKKIITALPNMFNSYNIIPHNIFLITIILMFILLIVCIIINKEKIISKILKVLVICYVFLVTFLGTLAPQLLQNTDSIWLVSRSTYAFGSIIGILLLLLFIQNKKDNKSIKYIKQFSIFLSAIFIMVQFYSFIILEVDHYILNYKDKINALSIGTKINEYELETGKKITKIAYSDDASKSYTYQNIKAMQDTNLTALTNEWAYRDMINYYNGIDLKEKKPTKKFTKICKDTDTSDFDINKIEIENDTLSICGF